MVFWSIASPCCSTSSLKCSGLEKQGNNTTPILNSWPGFRAHVFLFTASWTAFSLLFGLLGAFDIMENGGEAVAISALLEAMLTSLKIIAIGMLAAAVPVGILITRLR